MYHHYHNDGPPWTLVIALGIVVGLVSIISVDKEPSKYRHALVGDIVMYTGHECEFGVLYNQDGILMEDIDGNNIPCEEILLTRTVWKTTPLNMVSEHLVKDE